MGFRTYVVKHGAENAWLVQIIADGSIKVYRYMPDIGMAMKFETLHEARRVARECRGQAQAYRIGRDGTPYGEDMKQ